MPLHVLKHIIVWTLPIFLDNFWPVMEKDEQIKGYKKYNN